MLRHDKVLNSPGSSLFRAEITSGRLVKKKVRRKYIVVITVGKQFLLPPHERRVEFQPTLNLTLPPEPMHSRTGEPVNQNPCTLEPENL